MKQTYRISNITFRLPFRSAGHWVEDATGHNVCEAYSRELAIELAKILNEKAKEEK